MSMVTKRPQLNIGELHQLKWWLGTVLGLVSVWTVAFMEVNAWWLLALATAAGVAAFVRPAWPARVPGWAHRLAFPVIVSVLIVDFLMYREPLAAFIRLNMMLIGYRMSCHRKRRDDLQLIVLGLFMVVVAGVLTVSIAFAGQILAFTACALGFLLAITLTDATGSGGVARPPAAGGAPAWSRQVRWRDLGRRVWLVSDWRLAVLGAALFAGVVMVSALLFLAIPRFEMSNSLFLDRLINRQTRTGFSDEIRFGEVTDIQQDNGLALSVDVSDPSQVPAQPYWRMVVLDEYVPGGFRVSSALRRELNQTTGRTSRLRGTARSRMDAPQWTFYFEAGVSRYLPLLGNYISIAFTEAQSVGFSDGLRVVALQRDPPRMFAYRVSGMDTSPLLPHAEFALRRRDGPAVDPADSLDEVLGPSGRQALRRINEQITGGASLPAADYARRAGEWLAQRHSYSLQSALPAGDGDLLVRWIESTAPGHCELFAGALVLLARESGFPARLVTGFRGGTWNGFSNSFTVRNANAHAWVEIFDDSASGWLRADPTPGAQMMDTDSPEARGTEELRRIADSSWSARMESLRVFWYRRIVNFDQGTQIELARVAKEAVDGTGRRLRERVDRWMEALKAWWQRPWGTQRWISVSAALALVVVFVGVWRRFGRSGWMRWRSGFARGAQHDPVRREAGRWLVRLDQGGAQSDEVRAELERLRFGPKPTWPSPTGVFNRARRALRRARR